MENRFAKKKVDETIVKESTNNDINQASEEINQNMLIPNNNNAGRVGNLNAPTRFSDAVDDAKLKSLKIASENDAKFVKDFQDKLKEATLKLAETEREKAKLEQQNIKFEQELLETQQELNEQQQYANEWEHKQRSREYHFNGVKPIMKFVGIESPMNLALLYFLTLVLLLPFLISKLIKGTIGALVAGASDSNRPREVKGFIWTVLGMFTLLALSALVYLGLTMFGII